MQMTLIRLPFTYLYRNMPNLALPEDVCKKPLNGFACGIQLCPFRANKTPGVHDLPSCKDTG